MTTMISHLPSELIEEIISRVPLKCLREVQLTCKKWDTLSKSQNFSKLHNDKAAAARKEGESQMIMLMDYNLHLVNVTVNGNPSLEFKGKLNGKVKIWNVIYCEGLLLCFLKDDHTRIVVWNPYCGQTRWIKSRLSSYIYNEYWYALGYDKSCRSHKILRFLNGSNYEIYDFNSCLWRNLDVTPTPNWRISKRQWYGVSLKGNTYWCAKNYNSEGDDHIICFDFTKERFGPLMRLPFSVMGYGYATLSCVREEKLAVLHKLDDEANLFKMDIWITTKIEAEKVLWSKFLTLDTYPYYPILSQSFFIDEEKKIVMGFDDHILNIVGEDGCLNQLNLRELAGKNSRFSVNMCSYVPSSVQINQDAKAKKNKADYKSVDLNK